jgi:hypothetical protein
MVIQQLDSIEDKLESISGSTLFSGRLRISTYSIGCLGDLRPGVEETPYLNAQRQERYQGEAGNGCPGSLVCCTKRARPW